MMKRKTLSLWAIVLVVVFGVTVILYPMMFNSEDDNSPVSVGEPSAAPAINMNK